MADDPRIYLSTQPLMPLGNHVTYQPQTGQAAKSTAFADALSSAEKRVSFSKHALQRLTSRQLDLSDNDLAKLDDTVEKMAQKGARESLICLRDMAFIVSVPNRTVITAMDGSSVKESIFTNIDSAAIL